MSRAYRILLLSSCIPLGACALFSKLDEVERDRRSVYKQSRSLPDLEIPPDLTLDSSLGALEVPGEEGPEAPAPDAPAPDATSLPDLRAPDDSGAEEEAEPATAGVKPAAPAGSAPDGPPQQAGAIDGLDPMGRAQVLEVDMDPGEQIWLILREFWKERELQLELDDEEIGVQQTRWVGSATGSRLWTRYTVLSEQGSPGKTALLISAEQVTQRGNDWLPQEPDPVLGRRMAEDLSAFFDKAQVTTRLQERASTMAGGKTAGLAGPGDNAEVLLLPGDPQSSWETVGQAIHRAGLQIEEENRAAGVYKVVSAGQRYQISLSGKAQGTEVVVLNQAGVWQEGDPGAERILARLRAGVADTDG